MATFTRKEAAAFFEQWRVFSIAALAILAPKCPPTPGSKTRPWSDSQGPIGLLLHYTGGPDGIASIRWSNENPVNIHTSWHCTVLDSIIEELEGLLEQFPLVKRYLTVTALLHADISEGTWHGNWANSRCFGLENRNMGVLTERSDGVFGRKAGSRFRTLADQKRAVLIRGRWWESYTKEQLETNINIGKMLYAWRGEAFSRSWVLPHSMVWASKRDTGSAYPMYWVRDAIFSDTPVEELDWLQSGYPASLVGPFVEDENTESIAEEPRAESDERNPYEPMRPLDFDAIHGNSWRDWLPMVRENIEVLGGWAPPKEGADAHTIDVDLQTAVSILQRSTRASGNVDLKIDGVPGSKTRDFIDKRLRTFGHSV